MERLFKKISVPPSSVIEKNNDTRGQDNTEFILSNLPSDPGLAFRGNDESEHSSNHGNFLELLQFLADHNEDVKAVTLKNASENHKLTSPDIQKDIVNACATETIKAIIEDVDTSLFSILIDESCNVSTKEQMAIVLRYVDKNGHVVERFIGIEHVTSIDVLSLKETIDEVFSRHKLSMSRLHGQALVVVAKKNIQIESLFNIVTIWVNVVGASSKRCDLLREKQSIAVIEALNSGEFTSGKHKNQETTLKLAGETRWGSHFGTLLQELNNRFNETNIELLLCLACLCPADSFSAFDSQKLLSLTQFYPKDFSMNELVILKIQLETYILDMWSSIEFSGLKEIGDLAKKMVQCKKHKVYSLVYLLVILALTLPVATATVERAFSAMKILKN
ncbi:uncharacterized protein LOC125480466 [Pyrus x bretschneideri]|uniref:uncharacterized protein LOC125480466 n=1 Tax=Pyrus x bretschneideri TaxID=225117 RepID=UPI00202DFD12|nr:uncharacterized protein LOC125480466 [Pyrus x bretschneideri]